MQVEDGGCCSLRFFVQIISIVTTSTSIVVCTQILSVSNHHMSGMLFTLMFMRVGLAVLGLAAGISGWIGTVMRDAKRVVMLFGYYLLVILSKFIEAAILVNLVCDPEFAGETTTPCAERRQRVILGSLMSSCLDTLTAYLVGLYARKLMTMMPLDHRLGEELASLSHLSEMGLLGGEGRQGGAPAQPEVTPFSGTPHRVELSQPNEFCGQPQRLA
mmetsp:Transcript_10867/g.26896  ORF Transcript_10867/g.26896 Transcript_10867/m.26896 type:complete len:216 (-) Transcript_10867:182-829(-)